MERLRLAVLAATAQRQSKRILLVEDHEDTNRSLTSLLRRRGYHVESADNLESAIELSAKEEFDVLISDLGLPDGSGIDLMQELEFCPPRFRNCPDRFRDGRRYSQKSRSGIQTSSGQTDRFEQAGLADSAKPFGRGL